MHWFFGQGLSLTDGCFSISDLILRKGEQVTSAEPSDRFFLFVSTFVFRDNYIATGVSKPLDMVVRVSGRIRSAKRAARRGNGVVSQSGSGLMQRAPVQLR